MIQIVIHNVASDILNISINEYESIFSLKQKINSKLDTYYLLFGGKVLDDNKSLHAYNIKNGSILYLHPELKGGNLLRMKYLLLLLLVFGIISFFVILTIGVLPVIANIFYFLIKFTTDYLISIFSSIGAFFLKEEKEMQKITQSSNQFGGQKFNVESAKKKHQKIAEEKIEATGEQKASNYNFLSWIYDIFLFILKNGITMIFVYACSASLIIPIFFYRTQDRCKSLELGHYVGLTIAFIYFLFYGFFLNTLDGLINIYYMFSSFLPKFLSFIPDFILSLIKEGWDESKLLPFYSIPILGQILLVYHEGVEGFMIYLKEFLENMIIKPIDE